MKSIKTINVFEKGFDEPLVIGLGFFDCVHLGHKKLINKVIETSKKQGSRSAIFTFSTSLNTKAHSTTQVYDFKERVESIKNLGVDIVIHAQFDEHIKNLSGEQFLDVLTENFNIKQVVVGSDYMYGKGAKCNVETLALHLNSKNIEVDLVEFYRLNGIKLSSATISKLVQKGDILAINSLLSERYFFISKVVEQNKRGRTIGYPTANMLVNYNRSMLPEGVWATVVEVENKQYPALTNIGTKPTFYDEKYAIESFILDFNQNIYHKEVKLIFLEKIRDVIHHSSAEELVKQIEKDVEKRREILN